MKKIICCLILSILTFGFLVNGHSLKDCVFAANEEIEISSQSAYVCDYYSGNVVYAKNENERKPIASMTKVVSLALIFDDIRHGKVKVDDEIIISENAAQIEGSSAFLDAGSSYKVEDLIKSVIIASANDSMVALSEHFAGSEKLFVNRMMNTKFENSTGLPSLDAYSTAKDISIAFKEIVNEPLFLKYCKIWMDEIIHPSGRKTELVNTNKLVKSYDNMIGGKTGYTDAAKYCFVGASKINDMTLIASILGAEDSKIRFKDIRELFNYGFANFDNKLIVSSLIPVEKIFVKNAKNNEIDVYSSENLYNFQKINENSKVQVVVKTYNKKAPIDKNTVVGKVYIVDENGLVVAESNLIVKDKIEKIKILDIVKSLIQKF